MFVEVAGRLKRRQKIEYFPGKPSKQLFSISHTNAVCRFRYDYKFNKDVNGWIKHHQIPATWPDARLRCQLEGAVLASPKTAKLTDVMLKTIKNTHSENTGIFTGISAIFSQGDFQSVDGVPLGKMSLNWMPYEPDNRNNAESCIAMVSNGTIADVHCYEVFPYICYRERTKNIPLTECGTVDRAYNLDSRTGSCYKFHREGHNWTRAFMTCAAEGGHLAIINSEMEATVLADIFAKYPPERMVFTRHKNLCMIGYHDQGDLTVWYTVHGESLEEAGYTRFEKGQPDEFPSPTIACGGIVRSGLLDDVWCNERMVFICEKSYDSLLEEGFV